MTTHPPTELSIENSALVLIDHQPWVAFMCETNATLLVENLTLISRTAKALGVPTVLTSVGAKGGVLVDPLFTQITDVFPEITPIDRTSTAAWADPALRAAVEATGRKKLVMAGLATDVCLTQAVLGALKDGYEVYFMTDCSAGTTKEGHEDAKLRLVQAGAKPVNATVVAFEWAPDYTSPERAAIQPILVEHGGASVLAIQYLMAQVSAGIVETPKYDEKLDVAE
ncbi:isochorismatase family protein [Streptomyces phaeochromogenes]|uniref:isochorismatase family protein n=1 Tax=Streptomyces phaeochromogenes TaxID=1923 RepID=UPI0006E15193|nr:isochorismatase family protein [Streptomyces phaeochromogenes]